MRVKHILLTMAGTGRDRTVCQRPPVGWRPLVAIRRRALWLWGGGAGAAGSRLRLALEEILQLGVDLICKGGGDAGSRCPLRP